MSQRPAKGNGQDEKMHSSRKAEQADKKAALVRPPPSSKRPGKASAASSVMRQSEMITMGVIGTVLLMGAYSYSSPSQLASGKGSTGANAPPKLYTYSIVHTYEHDANAFTQALSCKDDACSVMYEATGLYGKTSIREVETATGTVLKQKDNKDMKQFGEGLVKLGNEMLLLLWRTNLGLVYDSETFEFKREFRSPMKDGWGFVTTGPSTCRLAGRCWALRSPLSPVDAFIHGFLLGCVFLGCSKRRGDAGHRLVRYPVHNADVRGRNKARRDEAVNNP
eukprot:SAG22_NODE_3881_length_1485_cov_1.352092_1_plen_279_part_00